MSHAVYEEEYLGNFPKTETFTNAEVPLPLPGRAADHQGLYLSTDGDQLLGRADNGDMLKTLACLLHFRFCVCYQHKAIDYQDLCGARWWSASCKANVPMRKIVTVAHLPMC